MAINLASKYSDQIAEVFTRCVLHQGQDRRRRMT